MRIDKALADYNTEHLSSLKSGVERHLQLCRELKSFSCSDVDKITNTDLPEVLNRWSGSIRNRYRAAITRFWKWGCSLGYCNQRPTLMPGKETPRNQVLSMDQFRSLYHAASHKEDVE